MNNYELTVILRNKEAESIKEKVLEILNKHKASISSEDSWGVKRLAYDIKGEREGFYILFNLQVSPESISKILSDFKLNIDILRYLFIQKKDQKTA